MNFQSLLNQFGLNAYWAYTLLTIACLLCYGNTLLNEYSLDDDVVILENEHIQKGARGIPGLILNPYYTDANNKLDYRPLGGITFALETACFGNNPFVRHLTNIIFYIFLAFIIYAVFKNVFQLDNLHPTASLLITLAYVVHPSHTEVVASVKNRDEIMSLAFSLLAMLSVFTLFKKNRLTIFTALLPVSLMSMSLLSKSVSLPVSFIILLSAFFYGYIRNSRLFLAVAGILIIMSLAYFGALAYFAERTWSEIENPLVKGADIADRLSIIAQSLLFYLKFTFLPFPFRFYYGFNMMPVTPVYAPVVVFSVVLHVVFLVVAVRLFIRKNIAGLFILAYFLSIANYINLIPYPGILSERALFSPSLWLIAAVIVFGYQFIHSLQAPKYANRVKIAVAVVGLVYFIFACALTIYRNTQWKDTLTLMSSDIRYLKNSVIANYIYSTELTIQSEKKPDFATQAAPRIKKHLRQAALLAPDYFEPHFKLGMIYEYDEQNRDSAFYFFKRAHEANPVDNPARFQLAKQFYLKGNIYESELLFEKVFAELPDDTLTLFYYAQVLFNAGKKDRATEVNQQLIEIAPASFYPYYNFGMMYYYTGSHDRALWYLEKTIEMGYEDSTLRTMIDYLKNNIDSK